MKFNTSMLYKRFPLGSNQWIEVNRLPFLNAVYDSGTKPSEAHFSSDLQKRLQSWPLQNADVSLLFSVPLIPSSALCEWVQWMELHFVRWSPTAEKDSVVHASCIVPSLSSRMKIGKALWIVALWGCLPASTPERLASSEGFFGQLISVIYLAGDCRVSISP